MALFDKKFNSLVLTPLSLLTSSHVTTLSLSWPTHSLPRGNLSLFPLLCYPTPCSLPFPPTAPLQARRRQSPSIFYLIFLQKKIDLFHLSHPTLRTFSELAATAVTTSPSISLALLPLTSPNPSSSSSPPPPSSSPPLLLFSTHRYHDQHRHLHLLRSLTPPRQKKWKMDVGSWRGRPSRYHLKIVEFEEKENQFLEKLSVLSGEEGKGGGSGSRVGGGEVMAKIRVYLVKGNFWKFNTL